MGVWGDVNLFMQYQIREEGKHFFFDKTNDDYKLCNRLSK